MKCPLAGLSALLLVAACAAPAMPREDAALLWLGASYDEAVTRWGPSSRSSRLDDGREVHTWRSETSERRGRVFPSIGIFGGTGGVGIGAGAAVGPGGAAVLRCERTLVFRDGRVIDNTWSGDADYCAGFTRNADSMK